MKVQSKFFLPLILLAGCSMFPASPSAPTVLVTHFVSTPSPTSRPTATEVFRPELPPSATDIQLPYNFVEESSEYCQPSFAFISTSEANNLSEEEIGYKLVDVWLSRYKKPEAHPYCRIEDYIIDKVYYDEYTASLPLEPKGDFILVAVFSIKLIQVPTLWLSLSGAIDQDNWLHITHPMAISRTKDGYAMEFAYP